MKSVRATPSIAIVALASGLAGCGSEADTPGAAGDGSAPDGPRVVLGTGRDAFEALESDGTVALIKGIQGGFHVWTSFLAYGFDTDIVRMELATRWDQRDESVLEMAGNVSVKASTDADGAPARVSLGWPASIFNPRCSNGRRLDIDLTVRDTSAGLSASDTRSWIVDVAVEDRASDCAE
ncbi:MAG TPA: hypothetical protein VMG12_36395 [Polyangiaceae bacterium]|nr:hypothetical protein [Polyangiaceae bacterium]